MLNFIDVQYKDYIRLIRNLLAFDAFINGNSFVPLKMPNRITVGTYVRSGRKTAYFYEKGSYYGRTISTCDFTDDNDLQSEEKVKAIRRIISAEAVLQQLQLNEGQIDYIYKMVTDLGSRVAANDLLVPLNMIPRYVLGTGVSFDYGAPSWSKLITKMGTRIDLCLNTSKKETNHIVESIYGNLNTGIPQILKQVSLQEYRDCLHEGMFNDIPAKDTNLRAICQSLLDDKADKQVLTFNYDMYLERELLKGLGCSSGNEDEYFRKLENEKIRTVLPNKKMMYDGRITIIHNHGYMNKIKNNVTEHGIVFTNNEYIDAYNTGTTKCYTAFYNHLDKTCFFIGNSITDYEEQKIIRRRHSEVFSEFHFMLQKEPSLMQKSFIEKSFFDMGIIILWFKDYSDIGEFIRKRYCDNKSEQ